MLYYINTCQLNQAAIRQQMLLYYAGELLPAQQQALLESLQLVSTEELEVLYPYSEWVEIKGAVFPTEKIEVALQKHRQLRPVTANQPVRIRQLPAFRWQFRVACAAAILVVSTLLFTRTMDKSKDTAPAALTVSYKTVQVNNGKKIRINLPDGSVITAGGGTTLRIPEVFTDLQREVFLDEGEVFFDVHRDTAKPFIVHTGNLDVKVLGTSFSVRDYKEEATGTVSVRTGKVAVSNPTQKESTVYLLPGHRTKLDKAARRFHQSQMDTTSAFGWLEGVYVFRGATLQEITEQLKHGYPVNFEVRNSVLLTKRFSATFRKNSIVEIMEQLQLMGKLRYTINNNTVIIQ